MRLHDSVFAKRLAGPRVPKFAASSGRQGSSKHWKEGCKKDACNSDVDAGIPQANPMDILLFLAAASGVPR